MAEQIELTSSQISDKFVSYIVLTISDLSSIPPNPDQYGSSKKGVNGSLDTTDTKDIISSFLFETFSRYPLY